MANTENFGSWHDDNEFQAHSGGSGVVNVGQTERMISVGLGAFLLSSGLGNLTSHPIKGLLRTVIGGALLYRGASGHCPVYASMGKTKGVGHTPAINIRTGLIVNKPKDEVYAFWRKLENLPLFMKHLASVTEIDQKHSHWEATIPGNIGKIKWNAEIVKEEPGSMIGWQSIPNATIHNAGKVVFNDAMGGQGTELEVVISYTPPAGELGSGVAKMLNPMFEKIIRQDVMNFKEYIETKHNAKTGATNTASNAMASTMSSGNSGGMATGSMGSTGGGSGSMAHTPGGNPATGATGTGTQHSSRISEGTSATGGSTGSNQSGSTGNTASGNTGNSKPGSGGTGSDQSITP